MSQFFVNLVSLTMTLTITKSNFSSKAHITELHSLLQLLENNCQLQINTDNYIQLPLNDWLLLLSNLKALSIQKERLEGQLVFL